MAFREILEEIGKLEPRISPLEEELEALLEEEQEGGKNNLLEDEDQEAKS
jgi:hypothetical protein